LLLVLLHRDQTTQMLYLCDLLSPHQSLSARLSAHCFAANGVKSLNCYRKMFIRVRKNERKRATKIAYGFARCRSDIRQSVVASPTRNNVRLSAGRFENDLDVELVCRVLAAFVAGNYAVFDVDYSVCVVGNVMLVRNEDDRVSLTLQPIEQRHDFHA